MTDFEVKGVSLDHDHNAAINIQHRAVGHLVLKVQVMPDAIRVH
jgi:hypothetical protein